MSSPLDIRGSTQVVGVIGWPIAHSVSPPMQNAALRAMGLDWVYVPLAVPPERLADAILGMRGLGLRGLNATVPHKQALLALVDELTPAAQAIGAVNTLHPTPHGLVGHNTDAGGFLRALRGAGFDPRGCSALVLGAGGAARGVVYALAGAGARVTVLNRTPERAQALAMSLAASLPEAQIDAASLDLAHLAACAAYADLVVNATTLGMWPEVDASPWPEAVAFPSRALCFDLVYNPRETRLMRQARAAGARASDGLTMLVHQGAESLALWTGVDPPVEVMLAACERALGGG